MRYDQFGGKIGGPILKNKLFFFVDLSVWVRPQGVSRTRTILTPTAASGSYTYAPTTMPSGSLPSWVTCNSGAGTCTANLLQMAQASGGNGQIDKIVAQSLAAMQQAVTAPGVHLLAPPSYYQQQLTFNNSGAYTQHMPDVRLDWNPKPSHSFEADYHLTRLELNPDVLNSDDYTYPVAPFSSNQAGYYADRQIWAWAWRWNLSPNKSNELRFGFQTSPESFVPDLNTSIYPTITTNLGSLPIQPSFPSLVSNPYLIATPTRDNYAVAQLSDNLVWSRGNHNMALGFSLARTRSGVGTRHRICSARMDRGPIRRSWRRARRPDNIAAVYSSTVRRSSRPIGRYRKLRKSARRSLWSCAWRQSTCSTTPNFLWGTQGASFFSTASQSLQSKTFGRITTAYQDLDTTDSPGGRMLQLVARFNF